MDFGLAKEGARPKSNSNDLGISLLGHFRSGLRTPGEIPDSKSQAVLGTHGTLKCKVIYEWEQFFLHVCLFQRSIESSPIVSAQTILIYGNCRI